MQLEAKLTEQVKVAVAREVEKRLRPNMVMNTVMKLEMEDITTSVRKAVIETIRQRLTEAVSSDVPVASPLPIITEVGSSSSGAASVASVRAEVGEAIRRVVTAAVEAR